MTSKHKRLTQQYSTWGDKLLQHTDVLCEIQQGQRFQPITVQLAPCEVCDSDCAFCSVANRPLKSYMPWHLVESTIAQFKSLGAKSIEITGGGNPLLYCDRAKSQGVGKANINDIIVFAHSLGFEVGIITNSHDLKAIDPDIYCMIKWIRISLIKLDEGKGPEDYNFRDFPEHKLGFSYIIYTGVEATPRLHRPAAGTTPDTIRRLAEMVELYPGVKFVRLAGNCLVKGNNAKTRKHWRSIVDEVDKYGKFFIKDIGDDDGPFDEGCYVGMIRPYVAPHPSGDGRYMVYTCTSHVLNERTYNADYALCEVKDIKQTWFDMNTRYRTKGYPYEVRYNGGHNWCSTCKFCYYQNNNRLLHTVARDMPDANFA
jgi:hypothetical protein